MLFSEPTRSDYDLNFQVFGIPVRVHPLFWLISLAMVLNAHTTPTMALLWVIACFFSILIHELGHALTARYYGHRPWITLYGMGGLASYHGQDRPLHRVLILIAGPGAGFLFAGAILLFFRLCGKPIVWIEYTPIFMPMGLTSPNVMLLVAFFMQINIYWGIINLFPVFPLDGGQIARTVFLARNPWTGITQAQWLSLSAAIFLAVFAFWSNQFFMGILFTYLAYNTYLEMQSGIGRGGWG